VITVSLPRSFAEFERMVLPGGLLEIDGTIVALNAAGAQLLARPVAEVVGRKAWEIAPGMEHVWHERITPNTSGPRFTIAIATAHGARVIEYITALCEFDGHTYVVAIATDVMPLV
jgi:nitrogen fixation/metabolism regulation signal transduction histidine kinase